VWSDEIEVIPWDHNLFKLADKDAEVGKLSEADE
jgi:hypothetical protein